MFVRVPIQKVLQINFDNTYPIGMYSHLVILSVDDLYEEIFGVPLTKTNFKLVDERLAHGGITREKN
ncbi:hypothetical protein YC2023_071307 [Brassica napus]